MLILITGGAGYIGTVLVEQLLALTDADIIVYDNLRYKQEGLFPLLNNPRLAFVYGDVRDTEKLKQYSCTADYIIPLAALVGMPCCERDKTLADEINHRHLGFLAKNSRPQARIIVPNSNSGYGINDKGICTEESELKPISTYGVTKCKGETVVMESGKGVTFRLATVFGTSYRFRRDLLVNDFVLKAIEDKYIVLFEGHFKRNFIHVRDVVAAMIMAINDWDKFHNQIFNLGLSSANLSKVELCEKIKQYIPDFVIKQDEFAKDIDKRNYIVSNEKLEKTGWKPKYSIDNGIRELIKSYPILLNSSLTYHTNL